MTERVDPATWRLAGTVVLGGIITSIDTTIVNVALDSLASDFHASVRAVSHALKRGRFVLVERPERLPG